MKKIKPLHKSWITKLGNNYGEPENAFLFIEGANAFRCKALEALELFTVMTNDEVFIHKNKKGETLTYVSQRDIIKLIEGLYGITKKTKKK
jgi:hypothetical protein